MRDVVHRSIQIAVWAVLGTACVLFAAFVFMINVALSPNLTPAKAAALISARPEFNKYATLVTISSTTRGADSLKDVYYTAEFTFLQKGSNTLIQGHAEFYYAEHAWHFGDFWYGEPPDVKTVDVGRDDAPPSPK
jgi:hypothetical protein